MKNKLAPMLNNARHKGIEEGMITSEYIMLIALSNIADEYMDEDRVGEFLRATEKEMQKIWAEAQNYMATEVKNNPSKMHNENSLVAGELIVGHAQRLRKKYKMDEVEDGQ